MVHVRRGKLADLAALLDLETEVFAADRMSRKSLRHFLTSPTSSILVAEHDGRLAGCAVVLFRPNSRVARLYSIAVAPRCAGHGVGPALLGASEQAALARRRPRMRLEVHEKNRRAIERYQKAGYHQFGCTRKYYADAGSALRFEKQLRLDHARKRHAGSPAPKPNRKSERRGLHV